MAFAAWRRFEVGLSIMLFPYRTAVGEAIRLIKSCLRYSLLLSQLLTFLSATQRKYTVLNMLGQGTYERGNYKCS